MSASRTAVTRADGDDLARRFGERLRALGAPEPGDRVVVAVSGGVDSLVLLHLLRFGGSAPPLELVGAHFDHRMRARCSSDASCVRGLTRAWRVPARFDEPEEPPDGEADARRARYAFLREVKAEEGAAWILTAHHADDQAETVLFRALRGTGVPGLAGIPERRKPGILRPLLPFWKTEIEAYARAVGIRPRRDPTNRDPGFARNVIRHELLPRAEEAVAPGARRALVRLARLARENEAAWASLLPALLERVVLEEGRESGSPGPIVIDRTAFLDYGPHVGARLLREILGRFGVTPDEAGTREAVEFTRSGASGGRLNLPEEVILEREFDRLVLRRTRDPDPDEPLTVAGPGDGEGELRVGGRVMRARWTLGGGAAGEWVESFSPSILRFPLTVRGWAPGDRIRLSYGTKKLKKLFGERRIPRRNRHRTPVVVDAEGRVLWVPGLARSTRADARDDDEPFFIGVEDADGL